MDWPKFLTGRSMVIAGGMAGKLVIYPIAEGTREARPLTNWAVLVKVAEAGVPPRKEDWSRAGRFEDLMPHVQRFRIPFVDAKALIEATPEFWEYPMCDRDPLPRWSHGRVTLLGDAAHPMQPRGANGGAQSILDCGALAACLSKIADPVAALKAYEDRRLPPTSQVVLTNRSTPPDAILQEVWERTGDKPFHNIDDVISQAELARLLHRYQRIAGFDKEKLAAGA